MRRAGLKPSAGTRGTARRCVARAMLMVACSVGTFHCGDARSVEQPVGQVTLLLGPGVTAGLNAADECGRPAEMRYLDERSEVLCSLRSVDNGYELRGSALGAGAELSIVARATVDPSTAARVIVSSEVDRAVFTFDGVTFASPPETCKLDFSAMADPTGWPHDFAALLTCEVASDSAHHTCAMSARIELDRCDHE